MTLQNALGPLSFGCACPRKLGAWNDYKKQYNDSLMKNMIFFKQITRFWEQFTQITSESLMSLFFAEWQEGFAHVCSFVKSGKSNLLTVAPIKERQER